MEIRYDEYKGHPVIIFDNGERYPISLGVSKLCAVVDNLPEVLKFLEEKGGEKGQQTVDHYKQLNNER